MTATRGYLIAALIFLADQISEYWIVSIVELERIGSIPILPSFNLTWVENRGVAMGLFEAGSDVGRWLLVGLTAAIAAAIIWWMNNERDRVDLFAMSLVLGGAIGNIVDRVRLGYVVDFVHLYWRDYDFYVFNVADASITVGVGLLLLRAFFGEDAHARKEDHA
ncbi:MAG: signal peptidase II [Pacificimonas sp.]